MNQEPTPSKTAFVLTTPIAIVIAGALVSVAIYASGGTFGRGTVINNGVVPSASPVAGQPTAPTEVTVAEVTKDDHIQGSDDAKVTLIEYSDLECPFCRQFHPTVKRLIADFPDDLRVVYRHFPLESIHPRARAAANASECAAVQGKFWEYIDYVFTNTTTGTDLADDKLITYAGLSGVPNVTAFSTCFQQKPYNDKVTQQTADAQAAGARGTPYSILIGPDGEKLTVNGAQPYETVKAQVESLLN